VVSGFCIVFLSLVLGLPSEAGQRSYPVYLSSGRVVYSATPPSFAFGSVVILTPAGKVVTYDSRRVDLARTRRGLEAPPGVEGVTITNADIRNRRARFSLVRIGEAETARGSAAATPARPAPAARAAPSPEATWQQRMRADLDEEIQALRRRLRDVQAHLATADEHRRASYEREMRNLKRQIRTLQTQRDALGPPSTAPPPAPREGASP
jgi:hypothetical protein